MILMDGKKLQEEMINELSEEVKSLNGKPKLVIIQVGNNEASNKYINQKIRVGSNIGIEVEHIKYEETVTEDEILNKIDSLNNDKEVSGIIVQLPLPKHLDSYTIVNRVAASKDVDGLTSVNLGNLFGKKNCFVPCTALGVVEMLHRYNIDIEGKHAVIVGRSQLVGKPLIACLLNENATVTVTHSKTVDLKEYTSKADILIVAIGQANFIKEDMVKDNAVVVDVGINVIDDKLTGDVDFNSLTDKVYAMTPVPNGVGRMTVISLMKNVIKAYNEQNID